MRTDSTDRKNTAKQYLRNIRREVDSAALYRALSAEERKPEIATVYKRLADVEQAHKQFWTERLSELGHQVPHFTVGWRTRTLIWLARHCGSDFVLPVVSTREHADVRYYEAQSGGLADGLNVAERSHARIIRAVGASMPNMSIGPLANALRAAVLGANDGLASNLSLVKGVAGAHLTSRAILVTGLSGLVAGACAMGMGEWLSVSTSRENHETRVDVEAREPADISEEHSWPLSIQPKVSRGG
jgi:vacuolar iron transporter family protein